MWRRVKIAFPLLFLCGWLTASVGQWREVAPLSTPRRFHAAAVSEGRIYVFGGLSSQQRQPLSTAECYLPDEDRWVELDTLPLPLFMTAAAPLGDDILLFGGFTVGGVPSASVLLYSTAEDRCTSLARMPDARGGAAAVTLGRFVFLFGGVDSLGEDQDYPPACYWFIPDSLRWREAQPLDPPRVNFGFAVQDGIVWVVGGVYYGPLGRIDRFLAGEDERENRWEPFARMRAPLGGLCAAFRGDILVVAGGKLLRMEATDQVWGFTGRLGWVEMPSMNYPRMDFALVELDGTLYAIGGATAEGQRYGEITSTVEVLDPPEAAPRGEPGLPAATTVAVWPNPSNGAVNFGLSGFPARIQLFNLQGRLLSDVSLPVGVQRWAWNTTPYPAGIYLYIVSPSSGGRSHPGRVAVVK